jgi:tetratricopeptide (TPR) repeat protein
VSDWDREEERREARQRLRRERAAWRRGGRQGPAPAPQPDVIWSMDFLRARPHEEDLVAAVVGNLRAYQACYAEAIAQLPPGAPVPAGRAVIEAEADRSFQVGRAQVVTSLGNARLDACLARALTEIQGYPGQLARPLVLRLGFRLDPRVALRTSPAARENVSAIEARARTLVDFGDGEGALRAYAALLRALPADPRACLWHVEQVRAAALFAGWPDHPAVDAAVELLASFVHGKPLTAGLTACLSAAAPLLLDLAGPVTVAGSHLYSPAILARAEGRYRQLLSFQPALPNAILLRSGLALVLERQQRWAEAAEVRATVAEDRPANVATDGPARANLRGALAALIYALDLPDGHPRDQPRVVSIEVRPREELCRLVARVLRQPAVAAEELRGRVEQLQAACPTK